MTFPELGLDGRVALVTGGGRGISDAAARGDPLSVEDLDLTLSLNLTATLLCWRAVGPHMLERRSGAVVSECG